MDSEHFDADPNSTYQYLLTKIKDGARLGLLSNYLRDLESGSLKYDKGSVPVPYKSQITSTMLG